MGIQLSKQEKQALKAALERDNWFSTMPEHVQKELITVFVAWNNGFLEPLTVRTIYDTCVEEFPEIPISSDTFRRWLKGEQ